MGKRRGSRPGVARGCGGWTGGGKHTNCSRTRCKSARAAGDATGLYIAPHDVAAVPPEARGVVGTEEMAAAIPPPAKVVICFRRLFQTFV